MMRPPATQNVGQTAASLTPRERQWAILAATGANERVIGGLMGIHPQSAKNYGGKVRAKLNVHTTIEAFVVLGWLRVP